MSQISKNSTKKRYFLANNSNLAPKLSNYCKKLFYFADNFVSKRTTQTACKSACLARQKGSNHPRRLSIRITDFRILSYLRIFASTNSIKMNRQHIVFLTGAGISAESGLDVFRGKDGLWTDETLAYLSSSEALYNNTQSCLNFYNERRKRLAEVEPNEAHKLIAELEKEHEVTVITQNVDNLHERAGSTHVIHLHGELTKVCSMDNRTTCIKEYPLTTPILVGDKADDGSQLRPYIVMFGEYVDSMNVAEEIVSKADIFVVIGTSLHVYPAAGFINYAHPEIPKFVIDPGDMSKCEQLGYKHFKTTATKGMKLLLEAFKEL